MELSAAAAAAVSLVLGDDDLLAEILLRLGSPTWLVRAAAVSTRWLRAASDPAVLRRFRALHPPRVLALRLSSDLPFPVRQTRDLVATAGRALVTLACSAAVCDIRNGRLLVELSDRDPAEYPAYAVRSLLRPAQDKLLSSPPDLRSSISLRCSGHCRFFRLLEDGSDSDDGVSSVCFDLTFSSEKFCAGFSVLRSGVWSVPRTLVTELQQDLLDTIRAQWLLVGTKFYMMTTLGYILGLDLDTTSFFNVQLPEEARNSRNAKFSGGLHSELILVDAKGLQLHVWHGDGAGQWVLVDTIAVREACGHLDVRKWKPDDGCSAPVKVVAVTDNAQFVILELVASGIVCCMQGSNTVVEKLAVGLLQNYTGMVRPVTMVWPPIFPVDKANQG